MPGFETDENDKIWPNDARRMGSEEHSASTREARSPLLPNAARCRSGAESREWSRRRRLDAVSNG